MTVTLRYYRLAEERPRTLWTFTVKADSREQAIRLLQALNQSVIHVMMKSW